ncbi:MULTISPECIES: hypothetical protein [Larkinella]|jgi:hypothetical protein|uniref:Uncharacterized protein n=2 Tax=Larkinella TaxID=332157 RepID=A0A5N1JDM3_9BACT|nr:MULTISPECIES: hypothetical protein [Larkinella]KAA9347833.1 hypothetical protein F0P93_24705 [Larkinella humicola]RCR69497.1 hypothetical protein DUE52_11645 [Larkinella punicea]
MNELATKLQKMQEFGTPTVGGYVITNFYRSNAHSGPTTYRLHFKREKDLTPPSFDVVIQYTEAFQVDYKDPGHDTERLTFPTYESVMAYLAAK